MISNRRHPHDCTRSSAPARVVTRRELPHRASRLAAFALMTLAATTHAGDLVVNGSFDSSLLGWTIPVPTGITFDPTDGAPSAGSVHAIANATGSSVVTLPIYQCIDSVPTGPIDALGSMVTLSSVGSATSFLRVHAFSGVACSGAILAAYNGVVVAQEQGVSGVWTRFGVRSQTLPAGTQSVAVYAITQASPGQSIDVRWDHIQYGDSGTVPVELQSFAVD
jgi:hypothetical protein